MAAMGGFNSYGSTKSCTACAFEHDRAVLEAYDEYSAAGWPAHPCVVR
jgi:hypothetical protein